ncbi:MAG: hypothetical protein OEY22_11535 [Candidatus Bathyarchaeota archaeon]|nr:hypothetical protein [Candidatus Bathyarchaeota archaeon]MDH5788020.1 hypothetical protein [Candidatus Bathyarchaeota archaeon]
MNRIELESALGEAGKELMHCKRGCEGVWSSVEDGVPSRHTIVSGLGDKVSCVIVSLAPPRTATRDQKLLAATRGYRELLEHCRSKVESSAFYSKLDAFRKNLGLKGAAVWTTLCKCERIKGQGLPSETMQACVGSHLARELELVDKSVPIIAVGNRVFNTVRHNFPDRFVLNVPSPDGSRGDFQKTMNNEKLLDLAKTHTAANKRGALCLCPSCARKHLAGP